MAEKAVNVAKHSPSFSMFGPHPFLANMCFGRPWPAAFPNDATANRLTRYDIFKTSNEIPRLQIARLVLVYTAVAAFSWLWFRCNDVSVPMPRRFPVPDAQQFTAKFQMPVACTGPDALVLSEWVGSRLVFPSRVNASLVLASGCWLPLARSPANGIQVTTFITMASVLCLDIILGFLVSISPPRFREKWLVQGRYIHLKFYLPSVALAIMLALSTIAPLVAIGHRDTLSLCNPNAPFTVRDAQQDVAVDQGATVDATTPRDYDMLQRASTACTGLTEPRTLDDGTLRAHYRMILSDQAIDAVTSMRRCYTNTTWVCVAVALVLPWLCSCWDFQYMLVRWRRYRARLQEPAVRIVFGGNGNNARNGGDNYDSSDDDNDDNAVAGDWD